MALASPSKEQEDQPIPALVFLSGRSRGATRFLRGESMCIGSLPEAGVRLTTEAEELPDNFRLLATLRRRGQTYEMEVAPGAEVWANGEAVDHLVLASGDVLELGRRGTVLRFRLYPPDRGPYKTMAEAFSDCVGCARYGGKNTLHRAGILFAGMPLEMATRTTPKVRATFLLLMVTLLGGTGTLLFRNIRLERRLADASARVEGLAALLERTEHNSFSRHDFDAARAELEGRLSDTSARVDTLEARAGARERVISEASPAVVFIQGAYGFVQPSSDRPLRFVAGSDGRPVRSPLGNTPVTLEGDGPAVELLYTGTGFVVTSDGRILTNRHVAMPWAFDENAQSIIRHGLQPVMRRLRGYLPQIVEPFDVELVSTSDRADVALLKCQLAPDGLVPLELTDVPPHPGDEVIVLGYPAGMQALLARTNAAFAKQIFAEGTIDFWGLAQRLAAGGYIAPLATQGIVGQVTPGSVVYDAETTHGGSGGPVIGLNGQVVAINAAIVPEFGGSNLGVPAGEALRLLAASTKGSGGRP
ncbi:MAG: trypsin-like peptidase domain-containing protein [Acidobacteriota bacterium]